MFEFNVVINKTFSINNKLFTTLLSLNEICIYEINEENKKPIYSLTNV